MNAQPEETETLERVEKVFPVFFSFVPPDFVLLELRTRVDQMTYLIIFNKDNDAFLMFETMINKDKEIGLRYI